MHGTEVNCIVSAVQRHLELQVIPVIFGGVGNLTHQLGDVGMSFSAFLSLLSGLHEVAVF